MSASAAALCLLLAATPAQVEAPRSHAWIPAVAGAAAAIAGGTFLLISNHQLNAHLDDVATSNRVGGAALCAFAGLSLLVAAVMFFWRPLSGDWSL